MLNVSASITIDGHTFTSAPPTDTVGLSGYGETVVGGIQDQRFEVITADAACLYTCPALDSSDFEYDYFGNNAALVPQFSYYLDTPQGMPLQQTYAYIYKVDPTVTTTTTPEPSSILLLATGLAGLARTAQRRFIRRVASRA